MKSDNEMGEANELSAAPEVCGAVGELPRGFIQTTATRRTAKIGALAVALAKAQSEFETVKKSSTANVPTKAGGSYSYAYADLADFMDMARGPLARHGLAIMQPAIYNNDGVVVIETILVHGESEQQIATDFHIVPAEHGPQQIGSCITYARKYALCAMLGIVAEKEDDDGNMAQGNRHGSYGGRNEQPRSFDRKASAPAGDRSESPSPPSRPPPAAQAAASAPAGAAAASPARIKAGVARLEELAKQLGGDWPARLAKDLDQIGVILDEPEKGSPAEQRAAFDRIVELVRSYQAALPPKAAA